MNKSSDVIVIGGGINGVSIAYHLAKRGASVTLLEKNFVGGGPSGLSSAIVRQHYSNSITARMAFESLHTWQNFSDLVGGDAVFTQTGFLLGVHPGDITGIKANIAMQRSLGIDTIFVTPEELQELEPQSDITDLGGAAYEPESGYCDPVSALTGFAKAAERLGAKVQTGFKVTALKVEKDRITGVETDHGHLSAGVVVVAAGPWSKLLMGKINLELPIVTARVKVVLYQRPQDFNRHRIWGDLISQVYWRPETGGLTLVGSISPEEETQDTVADPDNFNEKVSLETIASFAERVAHRYPAMERSLLTSSYASLYDITPDWHHILDAVPNVEGLYLCAGSSGHGFKLAPSVGAMMAQLVLDGKAPEDDINLFSWDRLASDNLVQSQYQYSILA
jgi:glycine/D-amino acid oxidase-like deaminating enzyme